MALTGRMLRAAKLDSSLYEEVEVDSTAINQAMAVVAISSLAAGIASIQQGGITGLILGTLISLLAWYIWAYLIYLIGAKMFPQPQTQADHGQLLRTIGFASSPGILVILGPIQYVGFLFVISAKIWMLVATVVAVKHALDYDNYVRALFVCLLGWIVNLGFSVAAWAAKWMM